MAARIHTSSWTLMGVWLQSRISASVTTPAAIISRTSAWSGLGCSGKDQVTLLGGVDRYPVHFGGSHSGGARGIVNGGRQHQFLLVHPGLDL